MRDFKLEIDNCEDVNDLRDLLYELSQEIAALDAMAYEDAPHLSRIHDLELLHRYGEHKLEKLLA